MFNELSTKVSQKLTTLVQTAIKKFDIEFYITPPYTEVQLTLIDTSTMYDKEAYDLAI